MYDYRVRFMIGHGHVVVYLKKTNMPRSLYVYTHHYTNKTCLKTHVRRNQKNLMISLKIFILKITHNMCRRDDLIFLIRFERIRITKLRFMYIATKKNKKKIKYR